MSNKHIIIFEILAFLLILVAGGFLWHWHFHYKCCGKYSTNPQEIFINLKPLNTGFEVEKKKN